MPTLPEDQSLLELDQVTTLALADLLHAVIDVASLPKDVSVSVEHLRDLLSNLIIPIIGTRYFHVLAFEYSLDVLTGDGAGYIHIPPAFNGWNLTYVRARVITAGTTSATTIQIANVTDAVDMLSSKLSIASGATVDDGTAVIDTTRDDVATNDLLRIDVDTVSTTKPKGLAVVLGFTRP